MDNKRQEKNNLLEFDELLSVDIIPTPDIEKNIFEISGYPHYENVISNWYAFFFDNTNDHSFGTLFLDSLTEIINETSDQVNFIMQECKSSREFVIVGGRIDILLYDGEDENTSNSAIIIENKIYAGINNDLEEYFTRIKSENKIGILLTLSKQEVNTNYFINITHKQLLNKVKSKLTFYWDNCNYKYLLVLKEIMSNINSLMKDLKMNDNIKFFMEHSNKINGLIKLRKEAHDYIGSNIRKVLKSNNFFKWKISNETLISIGAENDKFWGQFHINELFSDKKFSLDFFLRKNYVEKWRNLTEDDKSILINKFPDYDWQQETNAKDWFPLVNHSYSNVSDEQIESFGVLIKEILNSWQNLLNEVKTTIEQH